MIIKKLYYTNRSSFFLMLWMLVMPLLFSSFVTVMAVRYEHLILQFTSLHWLLFYLLSIFTMALALTPTTFVALLGGFFLGLSSLYFMLPAYILASVAGYYLAKIVDQGKLHQTLSSYPKTEHFLKGIHHNQTGVIIFSRLSPVLPFAIMNVVLSIIGTAIKKFILAGCIGMLPRTIFFTFVGSRAREITILLQAGENNEARIIFVLLLVVSLVGLLYYFQKIFKKKHLQ